MGDPTVADAALSVERRLSPNLRPYSDKPQGLDITEVGWRFLSDREAREMIEWREQPR